jgi:predicted Rossmann fold nucleotide-binding protein DprA/Smf involved in DNA uptake
VSHLRLVAGGARSDALPAFTQDQAFYALFESRLATLLAHGPLGVVRIAAVMGLTRPQTEAWLLRAEAGGLVRRDPETGLFAWEPA